LIAIDPGKVSGWALFYYTQLHAAGVLDEEEILDHPPVPEWDPVLAVIEVPRIYPMGKGKGDPNDLLTLALSVGDLRGFYQRRGMRVRLVTPRQWKGTAPKDIHNRRILDNLNEHETEVLPSLAKSKAHNMIDAIGLGLWVLGR
jgi:hypothetical protein